MALKYLINQYHYKTSPTDIPIYCRDCKSQGTWDRHPDRDIYTESGILLMICYRCRVCGATTLRSADSVLHRKPEVAL
jgi:hypothetical protein